MYRKFSSNHLFTGYEMLEENFVLITTSEGRVIDIVKSGEAGGDIEKHDGILCPGFINAHCHLELSHMKDHIPEKTGLVDFALTVIFKRNFEKELIIESIKAAENEMLRNGIIAAGDICNTTFTINQKKKRRLHYHNFIEALGFVPSAASSRFQNSVEVFNAFKTLSKPSNLKPQNSSIVPHAPYSVSKELFLLINNFPGNHIVTIHNQESIAEDELFQKKEGDLLRLYEKMDIDTAFFRPSGETSLKTYLPSLNKCQNLILVHNTCTTKKDVQFEQNLTAIKKSSFQQLSATNLQPQTFYCLCPNANLYISGQLPDVSLLLQEQCSIVLGTDSLASNHSLSILEEIKTLSSNFPQVSLDTLLQWATINGAKALQLDQMLGSFEKGKTPGVILIKNSEEKMFSAASTAKRLL